MSASSGNAANATWSLGGNGTVSAPANANGFGIQGNGTFKGTIAVPDSPASSLAIRGEVELDLDRRAKDISIRGQAVINVPPAGGAGPVVRLEAMDAPKKLYAYYQSSDGSIRLVPLSDAQQATLQPKYDALKTALGAETMTFSPKDQRASIIDGAGQPMDYHVNEEMAEVADLVDAYTECGFDPRDNNLYMSDSIAPRSDMRVFHLRGESVAKLPKSFLEYSARPKKDKPSHLENALDACPRNERRRMLHQLAVGELVHKKWIHLLEERIAYHQKQAKRRSVTPSEKVRHKNAIKRLETRLKRLNEVDLFAIAWALTHVKGAGSEAALTKVIKDAIMSEKSFFSHVSKEFHEWRGKEYPIDISTQDQRYILEAARLLAVSTRDENDQYAHDHNGDMGIESLELRLKIAAESLNQGQDEANADPRGIRHPNRGLGAFIEGLDGEDIAAIQAEMARFYANDVVTCLKHVLDNVTVNGQNAQQIATSFMQAKQNAHPLLK